MYGMVSPDMPQTLGHTQATSPFDISPTSTTALLYSGTIDNRRLERSLSRLFGFNVLSSCDSLMQDCTVGSLVFELVHEALVKRRPDFGKWVDVNRQHTTALYDELSEPCTATSVPSLPAFSSALLYTADGCLDSCLIFAQTFEIRTSISERIWWRRKRLHCFTCVLVIYFLFSAFYLAYRCNVFTFHFLTINCLILVVTF